MQMQSRLRARSARCSCRRRRAGFPKPYITRCVVASQPAARPLSLRTARRRPRGRRGRPPPECSALAPRYWRGTGGHSGVRGTGRAYDLQRRRVVALVGAVAVGFTPGALGEVPLRKHALARYTHTYTCIHTFIYIYVHEYTYMHTYIHTNIHVYVYIYMWRPVRWPYKHTNARALHRRASQPA